MVSPIISRKSYVGKNRQVNERRGVGAILKMGRWRNMYGPPLECKKNWAGGEAVCENVPDL
jgi:hypothetical protein